MRTKWLLRIAAVLMLLHTAGHTIGALTWQQAPNARVAAVIAGMEREHFAFMDRSSVSLAAFFNGYGISMIFVLMLLTALLWMLSVKPVKNLLIALGFFLLAFGVTEYIYFFLMPALFSLIAGVCTLWAAFRSDQSVIINSKD